MCTIRDSVFEQLGMALRAWRERTGSIRLGVRETAHRIGVTRATVLRIERGVKCSAGTFLRVAAVVCPQETETLLVAISRATKGRRP